MRTTFYKAANADLAAPYYAGRGTPYLPGTEHKPDRFDPDAAKSCTNGLYYCSHRRVAARWGPVVLRVQVLGEQVKTNDKVRPGRQPDAVEAQTYNKYRTDLMRILGVVGVTGYAGHLGYTDRMRLTNDVDRSRQNALENVGVLNRALRHHRYKPVFFTGQRLECLRHDSFNLWGVDDPNMQVPLPARRQVRTPHRISGVFEVETLENNAAVQIAVTQALGMVGTPLKVELR